MDHLLGIMAGSAGVPQPERCQAVGMNVLGCSLQLGKRRDRDPAGVSIRMINFEEQRTVGLHDERPWAVEGRRHQRCWRRPGLTSVGVARESEVLRVRPDRSVSVGVGDSEGVGVAVGSGEGRVTTNVGELRL